MCVCACVYVRVCVCVCVCALTTDGLDSISWNMTSGMRLYNSTRFITHTYCTAQALLTLHPSIQEACSPSLGQWLGNSCGASKLGNNNTMTSQHLNIDHQDLAFSVRTSTMTLKQAHTQSNQLLQAGRICTHNACTCRYMFFIIIMEQIKQQRSM